MNQVQVDPSAVIHTLSQQISRMAVDHAVALAAKDAEIEELKKQLVAEMDAEGGTKNEASDQVRA